jgi:hypothetical protein
MQTGVEWCADCRGSRRVRSRSGVQLPKISWAAAQRGIRGPARAMRAWAVVLARLPVGFRAAEHRRVARRAAVARARPPVEPAEQRVEPAARAERPAALVVRVARARPVVPAARAERPVVRVARVRPVVRAERARPVVRAEVAAPWVRHRPHPASRVVRLAIVAIRGS